MKSLSICAATLFLVLSACSLSACSDDRSRRLGDAGSLFDVPGADTPGNDAPIGCTTAVECNDGIPCTNDLCVSGTCMRTPDNMLCAAGEICGPSGCAAGCTGNIECADSDPCTMNERCEAGSCTSDRTDADGDGAVSNACDGPDCDDTDPTVAPGRSEICDNKDNDCDGTRDGPAASAACGAGVDCVGGMCSCGAGQVSCAGACVDTNSDAANCGRCGNACASGSCSGGVCACAASETMCGGVCVDTRSDPANCGRCGMSCGAGIACVAGTCASSCGDGELCEPARGCRVGNCVGEISGSLPPPGETITGFAGTITNDFFSGGYCTSAEPAVGACDDVADTGCPSCATCANLGASTAGGDLTMCLRSCTPSLTNNSGCSAGQSCEFSLGGCYDGCQNDDECRVEQKDTTGDGEPDRLFYDTASRATCSAATNRCIEPGSAGAEAGDACNWNRECESGGRCVHGWDGGYCIKNGCDVPGNGCAGTGVCEDFGDGSGTCFQGCRVGAEAAGDRLGIDGHGLGCRDGYLCSWNSVDAAGTNGVCAPGTYNAVTANNVGGSCTDDDDCYSPYGRGRCIPEWGSAGMCIIVGCEDPGIPASVCGTGNSCEDIGVGVEICVEQCTSATTCVAGAACADHDMSAATSRICSPVCNVSSDCRAGQTCLADNTCG